MVLSKAWNYTSAAVGAKAWLVVSTAMCFVCTVQVKENSPLYTNFKKGSDGALQKGKTLSHADVIRHATWPTVVSILNKEYVEV